MFDVPTKIRVTRQECKIHHMLGRPLHTRVPAGPPALTKRLSFRFSCPMLNELAKLLGVLSTRWTLVHRVECLLSSLGVQRGSSRSLSTFHEVHPGDKFLLRLMAKDRVEHPPLSTSIRLNISLDWYKTILTVCS